MSVVPEYGQAHSSTQSLRPLQVQSLVQELICVGIALGAQVGLHDIVSNQGPGQLRYA
jgi:hypothetical protein